MRQPNCIKKSPNTSCGFPKLKIFSAVAAIGTFFLTSPIAIAGQISDPTVAATYPPTFTSDSQSVIYGSENDEVLAFEIDSGITSIAGGATFEDLPRSMRRITGISYSGTLNNSTIQSHPRKSSDDGRYTVFLAPGDNGNDQAFLEDSETGAIIQILNSAEYGRLDFRPGISANGDFIVLVAQGPSTNDGNALLLYNRNTQTLTIVAGGQDEFGSIFAPAISADGNFVAYVSYTRSEEDKLMIFNRNAGISTQITNEELGFFRGVQPTISDDGKYVTYLSPGTFHQLYVANTETGASALVSIPEETPLISTSEPPVISPDGKYITYMADNVSILDAIFLKKNPLFPVALEVEVDFSPGENDIVIDLCTDTPIPITVFGSDELDVNDIDTASLRFADASVKTVGQRDPRYLCNYGDKNSDGFPDLTCQFQTSDLAAIDGETTTATLQGTFLDGSAFFGEGPITVQKDRC